MSINPASNASRIWKIEKAVKSPPEKVVSRWNLETPVNGKEMAGDEIILAGWALAADQPAQARLHLVLRLPGGTRSCPVELDRCDVIKHVFNEAAANHPSRSCGFHVSLTCAEAESGLEIGFETDGLIQTVASLSLVSSLP
jgi:hypothetical protein